MTQPAAQPPAPQPTADTASRPRLRVDVRTLVYRYGLLVVLLALIGFFVVTQPAFGTGRNALIIFQSVAIVTIVALGVTVSLAADGFDLSVGANVGFVSMLTPSVMVIHNVPAVAAMAIGLLAGAGIGIFNGLLIVKARVPDLLATLGTMFLFLGLTLLMTSGTSIAPGMPIDAQGTPAPGKFWPEFLWLGRGDIFGIPVPVVIMVVVAVAVTVFLERIRWGRTIYAIGGNREAARLAGIRVGCACWPMSSAVCWRPSAASCWQPAWAVAM